MTCNIKYIHRTQSHFLLVTLYHLMVTFTVHSMPTFHNSSVLQRIKKILKSHICYILKINKIFSLINTRESGSKPRSILDSDGAWSSLHMNGYSSGLLNSKILYAYISIKRATLKGNLCSR